MPQKDPRFTQQWDAVDPFDLGYPHLWIKVEHLGRYLFAASYLETIKARRVADIGCGTGYGSATIARAASEVTGVDAVTPEEPRQATHSEGGVLWFRQLQIGVDPLASVFQPESLDSIVCFETLEHLVDPEAALVEFRDATRPGGTLILSVPNSVAERTGTSGLMSNPFHRRMFSISSISEILFASGWNVSEVLGQPLASEINRNETRLIKRRQTDARIGDESAFHEPATVRRLAMTIGYPEPRDVERSYSLILIAQRPDDE